MSRPRILVVDDHAANVKLVSFVLRARGFEVVAAHDADEARAELEREVPALILMDVQLPRVDGLTLTRSLRADDRFARVPIVAVTAYAMASDRQAAYEAGCTEFMAKPIETRSLGALVERLVGAGAP